MPVLILCGADLGTQKQTSYLCELIEAKAIFNEAPRPVNDLRACLPSNGFTIRQLVSSQFGESRVFPHPLSPHFGAFLLVNYTVVQYTGHFGLVRTRAISMQNDFLAHKPLVRKWFPIHFANGSWARCSGSCWWRREASEDQCFWTTTRNETSPLLPMRNGVFHGLVECRLISFDVLPVWTLTKWDLAFIRLDMPFKTKLRHTRSKALWFILVRMWIVLKGTLEISSNKAIACTCRECPSGPRVAVNNGCRRWGVTNFWQPWRLQRRRGRPLSRSCSLPKMPLLQIGHDFPSNLGNMPSSIKRRMMPVSLAARSSWILRFHFARSLRSSGEAKFFCTYGVFFHASFFLAAGRLWIFRWTPLLGGGTGRNLPWGAMLFHEDVSQWIWAQKLFTMREQQSIYDNMQCHDAHLRKFASVCARKLMFHSAVSIFLNGTWQQRSAT